MDPWCLAFLTYSPASLLFLEMAGSHSHRLDRNSDACYSNIHILSQFSLGLYWFLELVGIVIAASLREVWPPRRHVRHILLKLVFTLITLDADLS